MRIRSSWPAAVLCLALAGQAAAQGQPPAEQRRRMDAFIAALRDRAPMEEIAGFFPRQGHWEYTQRWINVSGRPPGRWRFGPAHTLPAIREGGPICGSFGGIRGDVGAWEGALVSMAQFTEGRWRYLGRGRYGPPPGSDYPVIVAWREERGRWVVSAITETGHAFTAADSARSAVSHADEVRRFRAAPPAGGPAYAVGQEWYDEHRPIHFSGRRFIKYGLPRPLPEEELARVGWLGDVPAFAERGMAARPEVLYLLTAPGEYQPYQGFGHSICRE